MNDIRPRRKLVVVVESTCDHSGLLPLIHVDLHGNGVPSATFSGNLSLYPPKMGCMRAGCDGIYSVRLANEHDLHRTPICPWPVPDYEDSPPRCTHPSHGDRPGCCVVDWSDRDRMDECPAYDELIETARKEATDE